jgi:hypothetical protein
MHTWSVQSFIGDQILATSPQWEVNITSPISGPPASPTLLWPPDGLRTASRQVFFSWSASAIGGTPEYYELWVDGAKVAVTNESFTQFFLKPGKHQWTVAAVGVGESATTSLRELTVFARYYFPFMQKN